MKMKRRIPWLTVGMAALLLLAACGNAIPDESTITTEATEQPTASPEPTDTPSPTALATEAAATDEPLVAEDPSDPEYQIVTLLPKDAIPAIDAPTFYDVLAADLEYHPREIVLGVEVDGEARAYSTELLSRHEIVNDTVGGHPIAITW